MSPTSEPRKKPFETPLRAARLTIDLIGVTMKILKALPLALTILAAAALAPVAVPGALAQVTNIDVMWAISSIQMAGKRANQVPGIKKVPSVGVIRLDIPTVPMIGGDIPNWQEFKIMTQRNAAGVAKLQKALAANPVTAAALAKVRVKPSQVAGVQIGSKGALRLYIFSSLNW
jgi:hypothetical protein